MLKYLIERKSRLIVALGIILAFAFVGGITLKSYATSAKVKEQISLGNKYVQDGKYEEAILAFNKIIEIEPKNIEARLGLSKAYIGLGKYEEAERVLMDAINIDGKKVEPYIDIADLYMKWKKPFDAFIILNKGYNSTGSDSIKSMLEELKSKISVREIQESIMLGRAYNLPDKVKVSIDNVDVQIPVAWEPKIADSSSAGVYIYNGSLESIDKKVQLTLKVVGVSSIDNLSAAVNEGDKYALPQSVKANMTDNSTKDLSVVWNPNSVDTSKAGTYNFEGTVDGYSNKVKFSLAVEETIRPAVITEKKIVKEEASYTAKFSTPVISLEGKYSQSVSLLNSMIEKDVNEFETESIKTAESAMKKGYMSQRYGGKYSFGISYNVGYNKNGFISIVVTYYSFTGGAHGGASKTAYNYDIIQGKVLKLQDLFNKDINSNDVVKQEVLKQMNANKDHYLEPGFNTVRNYNKPFKFYFTEKGVVVYFGEYEIGAYAIGMPEFVITKDVIIK